MAARPGAVLETDRLLLREASPADAAFIIEMLNDPDWIQNIGDRKVRDEATALAYIETSLMSSYRQHGFGMYVVEMRADNCPVGMCGLVKRDGLEDVDIGFAFLPAYRGRGLAAESATAVLALARDSLGLKRVVAITLPSNTASCQLLEKLNFYFDGMVCLPNDSEELKLYVMDIGEKNE